MRWSTWLVLHAARGEQIGVGELAVAEVARLDPAFFAEGADAVIDLAQAHAHFTGELALGELGARVEQAQEAV